MISFFRRALSSWAVLGLLGLIMIAFIVTGVTGNDALGGGGTPTGDTLAKVDGQPIGASDIEQRVQGVIRQQQQEQPGLTMQAFVAGGGYDGVVDQVLTGTALTAFAEDQGLRASKRQVDGEIASIPAFRGPAGQFDETVMRQLLAAQRITEAQLRADIAADVLRRQMLVPAGAGAVVPVNLVKPYASLLLESRTGQIALVPSAAMAGGPAPTDAELAAWYQRNRQAYIVPERRALRYAVVDAAALGAAATPTEAEIAAAYRRDAASYAPAERRDVMQVIADSEVKARAFAAAVKGGQGFAAAASAAGLSPSTQTGKTKAELAEIASPALADAAFALPQGGTTQPAKTDFGWTVAQVAKITRIPARTLDQARGEITTKLAAEKAKTALADTADRIDAAIGDGASFDEIARQQKLSVQTTPPLTLAGAAPDGPAGYALPDDVRPLLKPASELDASDDPVVAPIRPNERFALVAVARVLPAAPPPLDAVRARVLADYNAERGQQRAKAIADGIVAKVAGGQPLAVAVAAAPVRLPAPQPAGGRRADLGRGGQKVPPPLAMLFSMAPGKPKLVQAPGREGWYIVSLTKVTPGDASSVPALVEATRSQFARVFGEEYAAQFANAARAQVGVKRNDAAIGALRARLAGAGQP